MIRLYNTKWLACLRYCRHSYIFQFQRLLIPNSIQYFTITKQLPLIARHSWIHLHLKRKSLKKKTYFHASCLHDQISQLSYLKPWRWLGHISFQPHSHTKLTFVSCPNYPSQHACDYCLKPGLWPDKKRKAISQGRD